jgi:hypothetical protein
LLRLLKILDFEELEFSGEIGVLVLKIWILNETGIEVIFK